MGASEGVVEGTNAGALEGSEVGVPVGLGVGACVTVYYELRIKESATGR